MGNLPVGYFIYEAYSDEDHLMQSALTIDSPTTTITVRMPRDPYLHRLRALAAWWSLGSSALEPLVLMRYAPVSTASLRTAGL